LSEIILNDPPLTYILNDLTIDASTPATSSKTNHEMANTEDLLDLGEAAKIT